MKSLKVILIDFLIPCLLLFTCDNPKKDIATNISKDNNIICTDNSCEGTYKVKEFINSSDVAHQFSNTMSAKVGDQQKALYKAGKYSKVDFSKIEMTTEGIGSGIVTYYLKIPFVKVAEKCEA